MLLLFSIISYCSRQSVNPTWHVRCPEPFSSWCSSPVVVAGALPSGEMVEAGGVPDGDLPADHRADPPEEPVAVVAHPQVLDHHHLLPRFRVHQPKRDGEPLAVASSSAAVSSAGAHEGLQLRHQPVDLRCLRVRPVVGEKGVDPPAVLHVAYPGVLPQPYPPHHHPDPGGAVEPTGVGVDVGHQHVVPYVPRLEGHNVAEGQLRRLHVAVDLAGPEKRPPHGAVGCHRHGADHPLRLPQAAGASQQVDHAGVVLCAGGHAVGALHAPEMAQPLLGQPRVAARREDAHHDDPVWPDASGEHLVEELRSLPPLSVDAVPGDDGGPRDHRSVGHFVEQLLSAGEIAAPRVHVYQRVEQKCVGGEGGVAGDSPLHLTRHRRRAEVCAAGEDPHHGDGVGLQAGPLHHLLVQLEGLRRQPVLGVGGDHGVPPDQGVSVPLPSWQQRRRCVCAVEDPAGKVDGAAAGVHRDEAVRDGGVDVGAGLDVAGVEGGAAGEGTKREVGAAGEEPEHGDGVEGNAAAEHPPEEGERRDLQAIDGETRDERVVAHRQGGRGRGRWWGKEEGGEVGEGEAGVGGDEGGENEGVGVAAGADGAGVELGDGGGEGEGGAGLEQRGEGEEGVDWTRRRRGAESLTVTEEGVQMPALHGRPFLPNFAFPWERADRNQLAAPLSLSLYYLSPSHVSLSWASPEIYKQSNQAKAGIQRSCTS